MGLRAGIVVTGTEVLTGRVADANGPWLAEELRRVGVDVGQIVVVGDRPDDLRSALAHLAAEHDLVITSGGLGPTADDLTAAEVADFQGRPLELDPELELRIGAIIERLSRRWANLLRDPEATRAATRKQAMVPAGATALGPAGTAPGLVVPPAEGRPGPPVVVLPGPPGELRATWAEALGAPGVEDLLAGAPPLEQDTLRLWGVPESEINPVLAALDLAGVEVTTCLREGELEIVSRYRPEAAPRQRTLLDAVRGAFGSQLFSQDEATVEDVVVHGLIGHGWTLAIADAATGGRIGARLLDVSGTSGPVVGVIDLARGDTDPRRVAERARAAFGADVVLAIGAIDVERVRLRVTTPDDELGRTIDGTAAVLRRRLVAAGLHLLREAVA